MFTQSSALSPYPYPSFNLFFALLQCNIFVYYSVVITYNLLNLFIKKIINLVKKYLTLFSFLTIKIDKFPDYRSRQTSRL